ncbi:MAG: sigma 54-interacting transcriptional regulator [Treponema sp.]|nr:sigma 54-interacting transcriptional regulator [Treponema sp.]
MKERDSLFLQKVRFLAGNNQYFGELVVIAKDISTKDLPVLVTSSDLLLRKGFSETIAFCKFKTLEIFESISCESDGSAGDSNNRIISALKTAESNTAFFLDNIERLSTDSQEEILGLLEENYFASKNILFIAGSSVNLNELAEKGLFSAKLAFRLGLLEVNVSSLNEIRNGVKSLSWVFLKGANSSSGKNIKGFTESALQALESNFWKNGVFQLKTSIEFAVSVCETDFIDKEQLPISGSVSNDMHAVVFESLGEDKTMKTALDSFKRYYVMKILEENGNNQTQAAKVLGLQRTYVSRLLNELHIR